MEAMCDEDIPGAIITSKHSAVIGVHSVVIAIVF